LKGLRVALTEQLHLFKPMQGAAREGCAFFM